MIRINKRPIKYASFFKITEEMFNDSLMMKEMIPHFKKSTVFSAMMDMRGKKLLRISFDKKFIGLHGDDFVMNLRTVRLTYKIITFKR